MSDTNNRDLNYRSSLDRARRRRNRNRYQRYALIGGGVLIVLLLLIALVLAVVKPASSENAEEETETAAEAALSRTHVRVRGLMTIPPAEADRDTNMRYFEQVRTLYVDINAKLFHNELEYLSMGMSGDYADAIRAGATMVRVGTAIFGASSHKTQAAPFSAAMGMKAWPSAA